MKINYGQINKILIIQLRAIGDVVLTTPVFSVLRKHFPHAEIHFLTSESMAGLVQGLPELDRVWVWPTSWLKLPGLYAKILSSRYQLVIDYQCTPGSALLAWISRSPYRIGWKMERRQWAYNLYSTANARQEYVSIQKCRALEVIGINDINTKLRVAISPSDRQVVDESMVFIRLRRKHVPEYHAA